MRRWRELTWPLCSGSVRSALTHLWPLQVWWLLAALLLSQHLTHTTSDHLQREFRGIYGPDVSGWTSSYMFMIGTFGSDEGFWRLYRLKEFNTSLSFLSYGLLVWNSVTELHGGLAAVRGVNLHCRRLLHPSAELNWEQQIQSPVSQNVSCIRKGSISASTNGRVRIVLREGTDFKCNYKCGVTQ